MNLVHIHLLLNHLPTVGFGIGICLYVAAFFAKSDALKRATLIFLFLVAVLAIPTYLSGNAAEHRICPSDECMSGVSMGLIRAHEDAALLAFTFMELTGFLAWLGLWRLRRTTDLPAWNSVSVLLLALVTFGMMGAAANKGGEIRHPEIHSPDLVVPPDDYGVAESIGSFVTGATGNQWLWPAAETIHFIGLTLLFTVVLIVDLRMLGMAKTLSFASLYQLLPLGMLGFALNLATGMLFFIGKPSMYMSSIFYWKILFIVLGGINVLYFTSADEAWNVGPGDNAPFTAKIVAASAIFVWLAVLYCGHMLPFRGVSF